MDFLGSIIYSAAFLLWIWLVIDTIDRASKNSKDK